MKAHISDDADKSGENIMLETLDKDLSGEETFQTESNEKPFNVNARRKIEEYLEKKSLASQMTDYYFSD
jgi:hypothetical protein